ncbi:MAG TPA: long-chain fatty acid--CoA ligase [Deltaproteobacteria bacterium]|nr:long-chain fatty acid--CoA ligase [Deltaproteobacteria bacterium]
MNFDRLWHKAYPPGMPKAVNYEEITMPEILTRTAGRYPEHTALFYLGRKFSFAELEKLVNRCARALMALGVNKGDKVAMLLPNIPQIVIADFATFRIGAVTVMNNPLYTEKELEYQLNDSDSTVLVTLDILLPRALKVRERTRIGPIIICSANDYLQAADGNEGDRKELPPDVYRFIDLMDTYGDNKVDNAAEWNAVGNIMYTGGTTGVSKGVMLTHANLSLNVQQFRSWFYDLKDGEESMLAVFPFFHSAGYTGMQNNCIYAGWTNVLVPRPEPDTITTIVNMAKPSMVPGVPTIFVGLLNNEKFTSMDFSFVKCFIAGGGPLALETIRQLKTLKDVSIINVYGLTEISPMGTATPWRGKEKPETVGIPFPDTDLKIVDIDTGTRELSQGEAGEVVFKGPQVMTGYLNKPEETEHALRDGWVYTGDIGFLDDEGYLTIVDRKKDVIVASGYNIYPKEVDEVLFEHPKVMEACTIGVPDEYRGETVKSFIVPKSGESIEKDELIKFCREKLAAYKVPRIIEFIDSLPKSAVGKVLRRELRDMERAKREEEK